MIRVSVMTRNSQRRDPDVNDQSLKLEELRSMFDMVERHPGQYQTFSRRNSTRLTASVPWTSCPVVSPLELVLFLVVDLL